MSRLSLACFVACAVLSPGPAGAWQSQSEPAEKAEEARKEPERQSGTESEAKATEKAGEKPSTKKPSSRVYTNEDLETAGHGKGTVSTPVIEGMPPRPTPPPPAPEGAGTNPEQPPASEVNVQPGDDDESAGLEAGQVEETGSGEAYWRKRASQARERIAEAERKVAALEQRVTGLRQDRNPTADVMRANREQERQAQLSEAQEQLEAARKALEGARKALTDLRTEARRSRVPPGWLR